jgi:hypothetical protein
VASIRFARRWNQTAQPARCERRSWRISSSRARKQADHLGARAALEDRLEAHRRSFTLEPIEDVAACSVIGV